MKLIYTGDFEKLKELNFTINFYDWYVYYDKNTRFNVIIKPITKELLLEYLEPTIISTSERESIYYQHLPEVVYDLIQAGLIKKEEE